MKLFVWALVFLLAVTPILAETTEVFSPVTAEASRPAPNFLTEFDITFWQTLPFAALWSYFIASQLSPGGAVEWGPIGYFSVGASALNAVLHARKITRSERK